MQIPVRNLTGEVVEQIELSDYIFNVPLNENVVHQALIAQRANARQGTAKTKTRSEVAGSTRKLFRQKHTGYARAGSIRSPLRRKGGIVFGPTPRDYRQSLPKKMKRLALRCILSAKVREGELIAIQNLEFDQPKTKDMARIIDALGVEDSALVVAVAPSENLIKSARNLPEVNTLPANQLNVVDMLSHKVLIITVDGLRRIEELWGERETDEPLRGVTSSADN